MTLKKDSGIEWIGEIPLTWLTKPLYAVGSQARAKNTAGSNANLLSLSYGEIIEKDIDTSDGLLPESFDTYQEIKPGDLVFRFTDLQNDKRSLRSAVSGFEGIITSAYLAFRPTSIDSKFLGYLMRFYDTSKVFYSMGSGLRQSLKYADVRRMPIVVPPNEEQKAIADFLDTELSNIDQLITKQESLIEGLFERRASLISKIVVNGVRGSENAKKQAVRWLPDVPEHWQVVPLWSLFRREKTTGHPEMELLSLYREHGVLPKASRDDNHNVESDDLSNYQVVHEGDLVVNKMKAWQGSISLSSIQGIISPAYYVYRPYHDHNSKYFHYLLRSAPYIAEYNKMSKGVRIGQWDLEPQLFRTLPVLVPTELEQREIVDFLDAELEKNTFLMSQSSQLVVLLKERRDALISAAVTGRIDVWGKI